MQQKFINANTDPNTVKFRDIKDLAGMVAPTFNDKEAHVPSASVNISGITCVSRSKLNANRKESRNSYATGHGASAEAFCMHLAVCKADPELLLTMNETVSCLDSSFAPATDA